MTDPSLRQPVCRSVFKNGESPSKSQFAEKWIALINRLEKSKGLAVGKPE